MPVRLILSKTNTLENKAIGTMKPGHVFTIEPMINEGIIQSFVIHFEGTYQDVLWPDDWTAVTKDGKRSAQFEQTILVTETGCEVCGCFN
jgi:methionyl aminopeptidase